MDDPEILEKEAVGEIGTADSADEVARDTNLDEQDEPDALPVLELDVHHLQVRALNYWAGLLEEGGLPSIESLSPEGDPDLGPYSILIDVTRGVREPSIAHFGEKLAAQWDVVPTIRQFDQAPAGSFLGRLADLCAPVVESRAPRDFKAEDAGQFGVAVGYRGIVLPFRSDGNAVDFIYAVITWDAPGEEPQEDWPSDVLLLDQEAEPENDVTGAFMLSSDSGANGSAEPGVYEPTLDAWLAEARKFAVAAIDSEERSRRALYHAISHAYDFSIAALEAPDDFVELARDAGVKIQERAPMTAVAKLVFGQNYDKTRLTEFATALSHAHRIGIDRGTFGAFLGHVEGGLKGVVASERRLRREENGQALEPAVAPRARLAEKLRQIAPMPITELAPQGDEFALVLAHRLPEGGVVMLGEIPRDVALLERAARKLISQETSSS